MLRVNPLSFALELLDTRRTACGTVEHICGSALHIWRGTLFGLHHQCVVAEPAYVKRMGRNTSEDVVMKLAAFSVQCF